GGSPGGTGCSWHATTPTATRTCETTTASWSRSISGSRGRSSFGGTGKTASSVAPAPGVGLLPAPPVRRLRPAGVHRVRLVVDLLRQDVAGLIDQRQDGEDNPRGHEGRLETQLVARGAQGVPGRQRRHLDAHEQREGARALALWDPAQRQGVPRRQQ